MKRLASVLLLLFVAALAACTPAAEVVPTIEPLVPESVPTEAAPVEVVPTETPAEVPTEEVAPTPPPDMEMLTGTTWQWVSTQTPVELITVADPTRYQVVFNEDGSANITADCNMVIAQYTFDGSAISITTGPSTLVACPPDSQADVFVQQLSAAAIAFFEDDELLIDLFASSGTMRFIALPEIDLTDAGPGEASGTVNAPDGIFLRTGPGTNFPAVGAAPLGESGRLIGISSDGQWYVAEAPALSGGQVWVSAQFVDVTGAEGLPVVAAPPLAPALAGTTWQWMSLSTPVGETVIADPTRYTITFAGDGTAAIRADCNSVVAQTMVDGNRVTIIPGPSTLVACPPDTQDQLFLQSLSNVALYFFEGDSLFMDMAVDSGTLRFTEAGAVAVPDDGTLSGGAAGVTFRVTSFGPVGAETLIIPGSTITAVFDDVAATVSGTAGCNSYTGTLTPVENFFTVGPIASTLRYCESPAGVMEQEAAFLAALTGTNGYLWEQGPGAAGNTVTAGKLFYVLTDGTNGTINLVSP